MLSAHAGKSMAMEKNLMIGDLRLIWVGRYLEFSR